MTARLAILSSVGLGLLVGPACSRGEHPRGAAPAAGNAATPRVAVRADSHAVVDPAAQQACAAGDTLLRRVPGTVVRSSPAIAFDSLWHGSTTRVACRVAAVGHVSTAYAPIDSLMRGFKSRGWTDRTTISADGPDGTVQGLYRDGVTCLVEGRWDGGDDSDTTYVPSDTMEVHLACTRAVAADTLIS